MNDSLNEDSSLSLKDRLGQLPKIALHDFIDLSVNQPFNTERESKSYVLYRTYF